MTMSVIEGVSECEKFGPVEQILWANSHQLIWRDLVNDLEQIYPEPSLEPW